MGCPASTHPSGGRAIILAIITFARGGTGLGWKTFDDVNGKINGSGAVA
jgi:hypothetical protein